MGYKREPRRGNSWINDHKNKGTEILLSEKNHNPTAKEVIAAE